MLFSQVADATTNTIAMLTAFFVTLGIICQIVLQVLARLQANKAAVLAALNARAVDETAQLAAATAVETKDTLAQVTAAQARKMELLTGVVETTHKIVNSQRDAMRAEIKALREFIGDHRPQEGWSVPVPEATAMKPPTREQP